jgi:pimeloyl-ACP methyl ester carboxylesterase
MDRVGATLRFGRARLRTGPELHDAEQGDSGTDPILFPHGWPDSWFYPETGHCPNWERPDELVADIDAFIRAA